MAKVDAAAIAAIKACFEEGDTLSETGFYLLIDAIAEAAQEHGRYDPPCTLYFVPRTGPCTLYLPCTCPVLLVQVHGSYRTGAWPCTCPVLSGQVQGRTGQVRSA